MDPKQGLEQSSYHILLQALVVSEGPKAIFCEVHGYLGTSARLPRAPRGYRADFDMHACLEQSLYHILLQALVVSEGPKAIFCEYLGT